MIRSEPSLLIGLLTAVVALLVVYRVLDEQQAQAWQTLLFALLPLLQALVTRQLVFAPRTIEKAGINPAEVERRAEDPDIPPYRKRS